MLPHSTLLAISTNSENAPPQMLRLEKSDVKQLSGVSRFFHWASNFSFSRVQWTRAQVTQLNKKN